MFVKVITRYKDKEFNCELPAGVILDVTNERANVLKSAGKAVDFEFTAKPEIKIKNKKEQEVKVVAEEAKVEEVKVEETVAEPAEAESETAEPEVQE